LSSEVTADFIYIRRHGPQDAYEGQYDTQTLAGWAGAFAAWQRQRKQIFCFFDNDQAGMPLRMPSGCRRWFAKNRAERSIDFNSIREAYRTVAQPG
jgi:uncharacterized protein YecE (DUF72 family)